MRKRPGRSASVLNCLMKAELFTTCFPYHIQRSEYDQDRIPSDSGKILGIPFLRGFHREAWRKRCGKCVKRNRGGGECFSVFLEIIKIQRS